jgi:hypothetical protein
MTGQNAKFDFSSPEEKEKRRIAEIRSLSYIESLESLFALFEVSQMFANEKILKGE